MIVLPVPDPGPDVTWIVVGLALGALGLFLLTAAWWTEALRNDREDLALAAHDGELADLRGDIAAISEWLGIDITETAGADVDTDEIPAQEKPRPVPGPRTEPSEMEAVVALTADEWLRKWREDTDREMAEMRAKWDAA